MCKEEDVLESSCHKNIFIFSVLLYLLACAVLGLDLAEPVLLSPLPCPNAAKALFTADTTSYENKQDQRKLPKLGCSLIH